MKTTLQRMMMTTVLTLALAIAGCGDDGATETGPVPIDDLGVVDTGPGEEDTQTQPPGEAAVLLEYLEGAAGNYLNSAAPKIVGATDVMAEGLDAWTIVDLRTKDKYGPDAAGVWKKEPNGTVDFEDGHIVGATLVALGDIVTWAEANLTTSDKVLVVCYSGHNAGHAVLILNLLGYDASSLKFGMSGWHTDFDVWSSKTSSDFAGQFVTDASPAKPAMGDLPELNTGEQAAELILDARIQALLDDGPMFISIPDVMAAPDDYFIVNYWSEEHYLSMGHIDGAVQYTPKSSLHSAADLATLPTDKPIVVYCYSGQHGSQVAAWLKIMGYDARDLLYGANGMIHDTMVAGKWPGPLDGPAGFDYVTPPVDEFSRLVSWLEGEGGDYINSAAPKIIGAADVVAEGLDAWTIIDMRTADKYGPDAAGVWSKGPNGTVDFEDGHIEGAHMVGLGDIATWAAANLTGTEKVLVVCYSGHNAGHGTAILNLLGYDASSLKFGMSSWHTDFDVWSSKTASDFSGQFVFDADPGMNAPGDYPVLSTGKSTGPEILDARVAELVANGGRFVSVADLMAAKDDYYIVNYWGEEDYLGMGHIEGAHQYTPKSSLSTTAALATLPIDMPIAVYCYSGQHGSQVAVYLTLLGYDAYDVLYGTNAMIYDSMTKATWPGPDAGPGGYTYVTD